MDMLGEFAPAKVNLCLHITGQRADGYHLLDSLACFAGVGDGLTAAPAEALSLRIEGPFAAGLDAGPGNLVLRAAAALAAQLDRPVGAQLVLTKNLPVASGIGGGSADAAAALRLLATLWQVPAAVRAALRDTAFGLGADVPVCLTGRSARMQGVGEMLSPLALPRFGLLLANPGLAVPTAKVFAAYHAQRGGADFSKPLRALKTRNPGVLAQFLGEVGNDLQAPAIALFPEIGGVLAAIEATDGCLLARMSGSGATCFGLYTTAQGARRAQTALAGRGWWVWGDERRLVLF